MSDCTDDDIWVLVSAESVVAGHVIFVPASAPGDSIDLGFAGKVVGWHQREISVRPKSTEKSRVWVVLVQSLEDGRIAQMQLRPGHEVWRRALKGRGSAQDNPAGVEEGVGVSVA